MTELERHLALVERLHDDINLINGQVKILERQAFKNQTEKDADKVKMIRHKIKNMVYQINQTLDA